MIRAESSGCVIQPTICIIRRCLNCACVRQTCIPSFQGDCRASEGTRQSLLRWLGNRTVSVLWQRTLSLCFFIERCWLDLAWLDLAEKSDMNTCIRVPCSTHVKVESQLNFWWDSSCSVEAFTRVPRLESFPKDLFLDTTYCSPRWKFVPQTVACDWLSQITSKELQREPKTLFVVTWLCGLRLSCAAADAAFWIVLGRLWQGRCSKLILIICWERPEVAGYHAAMHLFLCPGSLHVSLAASLLSRISKVGHAGSRQRILLRYLMDILHYKESTHSLFQSYIHHDPSCMFLKTNCRKFLSCHAYICGFKVLFDCKFLCEPICASLLLRWGATRLERSCAFTMYRSASYCIQLGQDRTVSKLMRATHTCWWKVKANQKSLECRPIIYCIAEPDQTQWCAACNFCFVPHWPAELVGTSWNHLKQFVNQLKTNPWNISMVNLP